MKWDSQNCYNPYYNPLKELSMKSQNNTDLVQKDDFDSIVMGIMKNFEQNSLPDSISILINFGTEKSHVLYDADQVFHSVAFLCQLQEENSNVSAYTYNSICISIFHFHLYFSLLPGKPRLQLPSDLGSVLPDVPRYLLLHRPGQHPDQVQCKTDAAEVRLRVPSIILGFGTVHLHG